MKALILAGGEGTRLRPLTLHTPKPVVPVVTVPFLKYQVELLRQHGIREVILSLSYQPGKIEEVLGDGSGLGVKIHYVVEKIPLGTAGAFKNAEALLDGATLVFNGDILCELDLTDVIRQHQIRQAAATLVLTRVEDPSAYGLVETMEDGRITRFLEKPGTNEITCNTINAGTYILEPEALSLIPPRENYSFERGLFPTMLERRRPLWAHISDGYWIDIGTPQKYLQVHQDILHQRFHPSIPLRAVTFFGKETNSPDHPLGGRVDRHSYVDPTVDIGEEVRIVSSTVGKGCIIGRNALIEDSVIWTGVSIGESARLAGCIVGNDCEIGRHAVISRGSVVGARSRITDYSLLSGQGSQRS